MIEKKGWIFAWTKKSFRIQFIISLLWVCLLAFIAPKYLLFIEGRQGYEFNDIFLTYFTPVDVSWSIFTIIYAGIVAALIFLIPRPLKITNTLTAYCILTTARFASIYLIPLEPSAAIIPLNDPFAAKIVYSGEVITKDLFFSGHVSTLFLVTLAVDKGYLKVFLILATVAVALLLMIQHVHFSIDVLAAPIFAWISLKMVKLINKNKNFDSNSK